MFLLFHRAALEEEGKKKPCGLGCEIDFIAVPFD